MWSVRPVFSNGYTFVPSKVPSNVIKSVSRAKSFAKRHTRAMVPAVTGFKTSDEAPSRYADGASSRVEAVLRGCGRCLGAFDTNDEIQHRFNT